MKEFNTTINFEKEELKNTVANLYDTMNNVYGDNIPDTIDLYRVLQSCWVFLDEISCTTFDEDY